MMGALYAEDAPSYKGMSSTHFSRTLLQFLEHPERGSVILIWEEEHLAGYALLVPYWSNEFGGTIVFIDELFVRKEFRGRGLGSQFLRFVEETRPFDMVACMLENTRSNERARRLYERAGFGMRENHVMVRVVGAGR